ncbi:beta-ketoacyl-acyl-carrier-protein synthase II [Treponema maltophilum ATCC 51939]|uniref:3-oxoacyl-[acyl-carrier-protein] synthase 2 n=1 Tax=Treponema maltophilum ATCC 51939 TaxID=1125699 RepID=S3K4C1_TREMA|nr:beta-ketoacyl-ACP synthase II [Treponema maltophilum]EPF31816.1 beta-ketoacyl-acyl-carrier-protein synthase II [Treponema maltophilum ATCC 51939]
MRKVVVTGMGVVSPLGNSLDETWQGIKEGKSGIANITGFDCTDYKVQIAAEVKDFDASQFVDKREARKMARFTQFAVAAAVQAVKDAGLTKETIDADRTGIMLGNGIGGFEIYESSFKKYFESGPARIPPMTVPLLIPNEAAGNISMLLGIHGPSWTLATACASGTDALGNALDMVRSGRVDMCLAGGTEATVTGFGISCFTILQTLASDYNSEPAKACCPFDKKRSGFIMGEGAAILILEEYEHAKKRGAKIYAEFAGYGSSSDAYHLTSPDPSGTGGALAMTKALQDAGVKPEDVQYYNAHGTSTPINDPAETAMIKKAFGDHAYKMKVSSTKSMTGHCLGAAGALEAVFCVKAIQDGFFPPTINLTEPDLEAHCDLDYVPNKGLSGDIRCAASGSLGFGGHNGVVVFKKI